MTPEVRCTLVWTKIAGGTETVANFQPLGFKNATLSLKRDRKFHCLIEYFEADFSFIGEAYNLIKLADTTDGNEANVTLTTDLKFDETTGWETLYSLAQLDMEAIEDFTDVQGVYFTLSVPVDTNDLWSRFIQLLDSFVDIQSATDLNGNAVSIPAPKTQQLPTQKIRQRYIGRINVEDAYAMSVNQYGGIDFGITALGEIAEKTSVPRVISVERPPQIFAFKYGGSYAIEALITTTKASGVDQTPDLDVYIQKNNDAPIAFTKTNQGVNGFTGTTKYEYSDTLSFNAQDQLRIYYKGLAAAAFDFITLATHAGDVTELSIVADTTYTDTSCQGFLSHDVLYAILQRTLGDDYHKFYSEYLGSPYTERAYADRGCGAKFSLVRGHQIRQRLLSVKPWFDSFRQVYESLDNILMLGLGPEYVDTDDDAGTARERIVVRGREEFYDATATSINLSNVKLVKRGYDTEASAKAVEVGYPNAECEEVGILDDIQGIIKYNSIRQRSGTERKLLSNFVAAGLAVEVTRRKENEQDKDWRFDNNTFIIALDPDVSGDMNPEFDENFSALSGFLNTDFRYNIRLWPVFNLLRHLPSLLIGMGKYLTSSFKFGGGNLNVAAIGTMNPASDCLMVDSEAFAQNQDVALDTEVSRGSGLYNNETLEFVHPLSSTEYKRARDNRKLAISVNLASPFSTFDATFDDTFGDTTLESRAFIDELKWKIFEGKGFFKVWKAV